jgi:ribosomal protein S18 acetylase RimI-like enzyme
VVELDRIGARAWPALEEELLGDWRLRFSRGVTGRANSVLPFGPDDGPPLAERVAAVERAYRARGLPPKFQLTPNAWPPELPAELAARGYVEDRPTLVMTADMRDWHSTGTRLAPDWHSTGTDLAPAWHPEWFAVYRAVDSRGDDEAARGIFERIELATAYASQDGAVGLGVFDGAWLGIYCMATLPEARRQGKARAVVAALLGWGRERGAQTAYLCTHSTNEPAQALYRSFGFETAETYTYFTAAG